jgi:hypothetical protein
MMFKGKYINKTKTEKQKDKKLLKIKNFFKSL